MEVEAEKKSRVIKRKRMRNIEVKERREKKETER